MRFLHLNFNRIIGFRGRCYLRDCAQTGAFAYRESVNAHVGVVFSRLRYYGRYGSLFFTELLSLVFVDSSHWFLLYSRHR